MAYLQRCRCRVTIRVNEGTLGLVTTGLMLPPSSTRWEAGEITLTQREWVMESSATQSVACEQVPVCKISGLQWDESIKIERM